tara:strand:- start:87 stop:401 length:315 start_codon:yes stop_codon:yes gene_type:complete
MTEKVNYPLPTVHLNGTGKKMLLEGNTRILGAINDVEEAIQSCEFHGRDYYVQDRDCYGLQASEGDRSWGNAYNRALEERQKHLKALADMKQYFLNHVEHLISQ